MTGYLAPLHIILTATPMGEFCLFLAKLRRRSEIVGAVDDYVKSSTLLLWRLFSIRSLRFLLVCAVQEPPYMMLKPEGAFLAGNDRFEGYLADILRRLSSSIGFTYEIRLSRGVKHDDDVYLDRFLNGVISEVHRGVRIYCMYLWVKRFI